MARHKYTIDELERAVKGSSSMRQVLIMLGLKLAGGNYSTVSKHLRDLKIDTSHFIGKGWRKGSNIPVVQPFKLKDILVENSSYQSYKLKNRLIAEGLKLVCCEVCGLTEWLGNKIPTELHHSNGNKSDNRIENLQILCPNCHSFTENYRGKSLRKCRDLTGTVLVTRDEDKVQTTNVIGGESHSSK